MKGKPLSLQPKYDIGNALHDWFVGGGFRREVACFAAEGMGVVAMSTQNGGHVEFDFFRIWEAMKAAPRMPKKAWMYHTHPAGCHRMSGMDANAIKGWVTALGMPIEMVIVSDAGAMRYLALKGNVIIDQGLRDGPPSESFLLAAMIGMSWAFEDLTQDDMDRVSFSVSQIVPVRTWICEPRAGLDVQVECIPGGESLEPPLAVEV